MSLTIANAAYNIMNQLEQDASVRMPLTISSGTCFHLSGTNDIPSHAVARVVVIGNDEGVSAFFVTTGGQNTDGL